MALQVKVRVGYIRSKKEKAVRGVSQKGFLSAEKGATWDREGKKRHKYWKEGIPVKW